MSLSLDQLLLVEESLKTEYDTAFPVGLAAAVPASCVDTYWKQNVMRVATSLFVPNKSFPTAPPANTAKRP
eukprot:10322691-Karenia_brevis.AAC.1